MTRITTSRATSHSPPPSHATRLAPAGTSPASASTASAQSRRAAGSSPAERLSSPASTRVNRSITPPLPPPGACPPGPPRPRAVLHRGLLSQGRPGRGQPVRAEPVQVPPRAPGWLPVLPARLDQAPLSQPDQDRVQRARPQPGLLGEQVAMPPRGGIRLQRSQYRQCLGGEPGTTSHGVELYLGRHLGSTARQSRRADQRMLRPRRSGCGPSPTSTKTETRSSLR